jgi:ABC-type multidrug transport system fused ATPase/permease subunit
MPWPRPRPGGLLVTYLRPHRRRVAALLGLLLVGIALDLANPLVLRAFIDAATAGGSLSTLLALAGLYLLIACVIQALSVAETFVAENLALLATNRLRGDLMLHCLRLDPDFHAAHTPGELIERVDGDVTTLANYFSRFVVQLFGNALLLVGVLALLATIDWRISLALGLLTALTIVVVYRLRDLAVPRRAAERQASAALFGFLEERLAGTEDLRASGAIAFTLRQLAERSRTLLRTRRAAFIIGSATGGVTLVLLALGTAVGLGLGAWLYLTGSITIGTVFAILAYTQMLGRPLEQISRQLQDLQQATASVGRIRDLLATTSAIDAGGEASLPSGPLAVAFDGVSFAYEGDEPVLAGLTFAASPGAVLGVLGRTGSGKTTLTRLLFRLYDPTAGAIRMGGVDLRAAPLAEVRRRVGLVTQEIQLFHASVRDNLTFFDPTVPDERIIQTLGDLGLGAWLDGLPDGLETLLAPGGGGLSAGEAQLLAFARVFLQDPGLVILDEASSRLDPASESRLEVAVDRLLAGRTGIIIAHRLATVQRADEILILDDGRRDEWGPRAALAADPESRFAALLRTGLEEALA